MGLQNTQRSIPVDNIDEILKSREGWRGFTREEAARLVEWHRSAMEPSPIVDLANDPLVSELSVLGVGADTAALEHVARLRQLRRPQAEAVARPRRSKRGLHTIVEIPFPGCSLVVAPPPYSTGGPLDEQFGADSVVISDDIELGPTSSASSVASTGKTFSALALPEVGELSLGVGLGTIRTSPAFRSVYPPQEEHDSVVGAPYLLDVSSATANLLHFANPIPGAPLVIKSSVKVTVDVTVGNVESFYLVDVSGSNPPIYVQAFGSARLVVTSSTGRVNEASIPFLDHKETPQSAYEVNVLREFSVSQDLKLDVGTKWISAFVAVRLAVQRLFLGGILKPPVNDRGGFVIIDLRSPAVPTQQIHPILKPGGPIRVSRLAMTFCPEEIVGN